MRQVWAIAANLITELLKMRFLVLFVLLITACYTAGFAFWLHTSDGLADHKIQTFLSYSLSIAWVVLSLLTVFCSTATITRDIKRREIFTIATKPVSRGQFLIGKFLGAAVFSLVLLLINGVAIYSLARLLQQTETAGNTPADRASALRAKELIFVARRAVPAPQPDISAQVKEYVDARIEEYKRANPQDKRNAARIQALRAELTINRAKELISKAGSVPPSHTRTWCFTGLEPVDRENGFVFVRYKQEVSQNPPDLTLWNQWRVGPEDPAVGGGTALPPQKQAIRTVHEFAVPVTELSPTGDLYVTYGNPVVNAPVTVMFPPIDGLEVLYVADTFEANYIRTIAVMYLRLLFLAVLGVAVGAWLSFPVAILLAMAVFMMGLSSSFILDAVKWEAGQTHQSLIRTIMLIWPNLSAYDPVIEIEKGRLVPWQMLIKASTIMLLLKGGVIAFIGYLVFKFRELARVIV